MTLNDILILGLIGALGLIWIRLGDVMDLIREQNQILLEDVKDE